MACNRARFMANNFADSDAWTSGSVSVSSEVADYEGANAAIEDRNITWRPAGNFTVDDNNNQMSFRESGGPDVFVTLTNGNYDGDGLAAEINAKVLAATGQNILATHTSAGFFAFTGPAGFEFFLSNQTDAIWDTIGFTGTADADLTGATFADEKRFHSDDWYKLDAGFALSVTGLCAVAPIDKILGFTEGASIKLQANNVDLWENPPLSLDVPYDDRGLYYFPDIAATSDTYQYWRLWFSDPLNPKIRDGELEFSHIYLGDHIDLERNVSVGFQKQRLDPSIRLQSESGAEFYDTRPKSKSFAGLKILNMGQADRLKLEKLYHKVGKSNPFHLSIDPSASVSEDTEDFSAYVRFTADPRFGHVIGKLFSTDLSVKEVL